MTAAMAANSGYAPVRGTTSERGEFDGIVVEPCAPGCRPLRGSQNGEVW